jgi:putative transposase
VCENRPKQSLSYPLRLPDHAQEDALRLLDVSRTVINLTLEQLWDRLDEFGEKAQGPAYKQVGSMIGSPDPHGDRQWRCESEQAGRILRAQAERKSQFALILPLLSQGMILPAKAKKPAGKDRKLIREAVADLKKESSEGHAVALQSLIEQACNYYLEGGCFPETYQEMQPIPVMKAAQLPYAGDDGAEKGQSFQMSIDLDKKQIRLSLRGPDATGLWRRDWRGKEILLRLPDRVAERLKEGKALAPTLREIVETEGSRYAVLDLILEVEAEDAPKWEETHRVLGFDWGVRTLATTVAVDLAGNQVGRPFFLNTGCFDGRQARTRKQIDLLKAKVSKIEAKRKEVAKTDPRHLGWTKKLKELEIEIARCWRKYEARNRDLAHLAANSLLTLSIAFNCEMIAGESLKSMKSQGRGRGAKRRWRNWRNNSQIRGELWRVLRYKAFLTGIHLEWQKPKHTSHTCPRCGMHTDTYASPEHTTTVLDWGAWLFCSHCHYNAARDYAAALNMARLGATLILQAQKTGRVIRPSIADKAVKPLSYMGGGAVLRLPSPVLRDRLLYAGRIYVNGWKRSVTLRSSYISDYIFRLCS